jgi:8-oxo-dGTP pyrophosphatase MutT (NUDIX family)
MELKKKFLNTPHMEVYSVPVKYENIKTDPFFICKRKDSVSIIIEKGEKILLVYQHRFACNKYGWEIPQGSIEKNESFAQAALREAKEETGYIPEILCELGEIYEAGDWCTTKSKIFVSKKIHSVKSVPELTFEWYDMEEIGDLIKRGLIFDSITLSALYLYKYNK